jgi:N-acetylglucosamine-6-phosphate deacetylase
MSVRELAARRLIAAEGVVEYPRIAIDADGNIASIEHGEPGASKGELAEATLAPAFFDVHVHGAAGHDVMEGSREALDQIGAFLAGRGVGHYLATTVTAAVDKTLHALEGIAAGIETANHENTAQPVGIHLEGPFISHARRGVHPPAEIQRPSIELFERFQQVARGNIRLMTIAPETAGALDLIRHAGNKGVRVSLGHSDATAAETLAGIAAGAVSATHTFNAMRRLDHREPGIAGVVLDARDLYAELICDGIHVAPEFVRLWLLAKGPQSDGIDRAILVTDGISATGMPDGNYMLGELEVAVAGGHCLLASDLAEGKRTLAGSVLTMDRAAANLQAFTGASLATAVRLASRNPARMLGLDELCSLAPGRPANFNVFSAGGTLRQTMLRGSWVSGELR